MFHQCLGPAGNKEYHLSPYKDFDTLTTLLVICSCFFSELAKPVIAAPMSSACRLLLQEVPCEPINGADLPIKCWLNLFQ